MASSVSLRGQSHQARTGAFDGRTLSASLSKLTIPTLDLPFLSSSSYSPRSNRPRIGMSRSPPTLDRITHTHTGYQDSSSRAAPSPREFVYRPRYVIALGCAAFISLQKRSDDSRQNHFISASRVMGTDENRARLLVHKAPQTIVSFLDRTLRSAPASARFDTPTLTLLRTATGALLNLQLDHGTFDKPAKFHIS